MLRYYQRIFQAYLGGGRSHLSFWHETPAVNEAAFEPDSLQFYMTFEDKTRYAGPFDDKGVPMLDYRGSIGRQYNPIAIAQYGLGCLNGTYRSVGVTECGSKEDGFSLSTPTRPYPDTPIRPRYLACADWLVDHLETNKHGLRVWHHHFDWEYFRLLKAPWYSGLAQGQGIALLLRAYADTKESKYLDAAAMAFVPLVTKIEDGGVLFIDEDDDWWIEEYITDPPTHILNGFIWALWGVCDYRKESKVEGRKSKDAEELWERGVRTLVRNLHRFDCGYWSLYDLSPGWPRNVASPFYHRLHLVQLDVMHRLTGEVVFKECHDRWQQYQSHTTCRLRSLAAKIIFKLFRF